MNEAHTHSRHVLILGLDTFARKNIVQVAALEAEGYAFTVVTNDQRGDSRAIFDAQGFTASRLVVVRGWRVKIATAWRQLRAGPLHHVELVGAGRMLPAYLLMLKLLRIPFLVVERGDIGCLDRYGPLTRASLKLAYRLATRIVYKETYMEAPLRALTAAPLDFVPNCVAAAAVPEGERREIDFLWVNRLVPERRIDWLTAAFGEPPLSGLRLAILGANAPERLSAPGAKAEILPFTDPRAHYRASRFFCLPSSIVFGNNSLLEAMAAGVVPVVTQAPGVELIVEDGVNGIVSAFDEESYRRGLERAATLGDDEWRRLSRKAVETVRERYSVPAWTRRMADVYGRLDVRETAPPASR